MIILLLYNIYIESIIIIFYITLNFFFISFLFYFLDYFFIKILYFLNITKYLILIMKIFLYDNSNTAILTSLQIHII